MIINPESGLFSSLKLQVIDFVMLSDNIVHVNKGFTFQFAINIIIIYMCTCVRIEFYRSWARGPVLIVRTDDH
jgi:hypothetical protein